MSLTRAILLEIPYDELLTYARKISKYTQPPNARSQQPPPQAGTDDTAPPADGEARPRVNVGLTNDEAAALDPSSRVVFTPWPSEEIMRRGALAQIAFSGEGIVTNKPLEQPVNGANGGAAAAAEVKAEQQVDGEGETLMNGASGEATVGQGGQGQGQGVVVQSYPVRDVERERRAREEQHSQAFFGLDLYDPDED